MEQATIANHIKSLSKGAFDAVVTLLFQKFYDLTAANIDGAGDGGSDMRCFKTKRLQSAWVSTAIQNTVTSQSWRKKALADAEKAVRELDAAQFYFLTSRAHQSSELRRLESEIQLETGIPAVCLGANEIAGLIRDTGLLIDFAEAIGLPMHVTIRERPDRQEMLLHAFASLSDERKVFKEGVFEDALLISVFESESSIDRIELVKRAADLLGLPDVMLESLEKRVDSLFTKGRLFLKDGYVVLSDHDTFDLKASAGMYVNELKSMASAQELLLNELGVTSWSAERSQETAVLLSRLFVQNQLQIAERASLPMTKIGLSRQLGDPKAELYKLLKKSGLDIESSEKAIKELVSLGSDRPLIQRLTRAVTYIATEGRSITQACRSLGASKWSDVIVTLDASVAIPYLCSSLFQPTEGRFSIGANQCLKILRDLNAKLVMPYFYINETAAHLLLALNTPEGVQYAQAAEHSKNGFVSHYFQLKNHGKKVPDTLRDFIGIFSKIALKGNGDRREKARTIMPDIQSILRDYGVDFESIQTFTPDSVGYRTYRKPTEECFDHLLNQRQKNRRRNLINNDVNVLAYAKQQVAETGEARMCLTWDRTMIAVATDVRDCGWIVTPNEASDLVQSSVDFSETRLTSLAHALAKVKQTPDEIGASILDRIAYLSGSKLQDWEFKTQFDKFYSSVMDRIARDPASIDWVDGEVEEFIAGQQERDDQDEIDVPE